MFLGALLKILSSKLFTFCFRHLFKYIVSIYVKIMPKQPNIITLLCKVQVKLNQHNMRAIHIVKYGRSPELRSIAIPTRKNEEILVKMKYCPINPSDLNFYLGLYGIRKENFPIVGFEGSGVILQSHEKGLIGRKVSVLANNTNGTFATHIVSNPSDLTIWPQNSPNSLESISMASINPISCIGLSKIVKDANPKAVVLSAVTSNVSKMIVRYLRQKQFGKHLKIIGVSRSPQYDEQIKKLGVDYVFRIDEIDKIKEMTATSGKSVFLDCIGGEFAGKVFNALPKNSMMVNYGRLSKENLGGLDLGQLYFGNKQIRGFWMNTFLQQINSEQLALVKQQIIQYSFIFEQPIRKVFPLSDYLQAMKQSIKNQSQGKILLDLQ